MDGGRHQMLVEILLPVFEARSAVLDSRHQQTAGELIDRFGGITAYNRAPAEGTWQPNEGQAVVDSIVVYEVMVPKVDRAWWEEYRQLLEKRFEQDVVVIRCHPIQIL